MESIVSLVVYILFLFFGLHLLKINRNLSKGFEGSTFTYYNRFFQLKTDTANNNHQRMLKLFGLGIVIFSIGNIILDIIKLFK